MQTKYRQQQPDLVSTQLCQPTLLRTAGYRLFGLLRVEGLEGLQNIAKTSNTDNYGKYGMVQGKCHLAFCQKPTPYTEHRNRSSSTATTSLSWYFLIINTTDIVIIIIISTTIISGSSKKPGDHILVPVEAHPCVTTAGTEEWLALPGSEGGFFKQKPPIGALYGFGL